MFINVKEERLDLMASITCISAQVETAKAHLERLEYQWGKIQEMILKLIQETDNA